MEENKENKSNKTPLLVTLAVVALVFGCAGLVLGWLGYEKASTPITFLGSGTDGNSANFAENSIADIADKVSKSVVSIVTSSKTTDMFGQSYDSAAAGTGIIVTSDGYILTNKHVINGASKVTVVLDDGTTYEDVKVVATDPLNDVAYLKIDDVSELTAATLGDSKTISVGQQVIAIGNALGQYQNTVTAGIISGTGRSVTASDGTNHAETLSDISSRIDLNIDAWADKDGFERSYVPDCILSGTGAGDTSIAAFLASVLNGETPETAMQLATATGACCVTSYDALGGLKPLDELKEKISAGWKKNGEL